MTTLPLDTQTFDYISDLVRNRSYIVLDKGKDYLVESRLVPVALECGFETLGQELYSIAMLVKENFPELATWKLKLIGADLSSKILKRAKSGVFNQTEMNRGLPMQLLLKYFTKDGVQWRIAEEIHNMIDVQALNLIEQFPSSMQKMDVVFLRNVLIYFSPEMKTSILNKVRASLARDGYLFMGNAETTLNLNVKFKKQLIGNAVCFRPI